MQKEILMKLLENNMSYSEISKRENISKCMISYYVKKYSLNAAKKNKVLNENDLKKLYLEDLLSTEQIAKSMGVWQKSVLFWLKKYGIKIRPIGTNQFSPVSISTVKEVFESNGHVLISDEYKGFYEKLNFRCHCGEEDEISYGVMKRGASCKKCRSRNTGGIKKESIKDIKKFVESKNCIFLEKFIHKQKTRIKYICSCGSPHEMYMSNFKKGYSCKECKRRKLLGKNNHNFNKNLSDFDRLELGRYEEGYRAWRRLVYRKFNYKCDICKKDGENDLTAHHLEGYSENVELRTDLENGVCLCLKCHKDFHSSYGYGDNTKKQYDEFKLKISEVSLGRSHI